MAWRRRRCSMAAHCDFAEAGVKLKNLQETCTKFEMQHVCIPDGTRSLHPDGASLPAVWLLGYLIRINPISYRNVHLRTNNLLSISHCHAILELRTGGEV